MAYLSVADGAENKKYCFTTEDYFGVTVFVHLLCLK